MASSSSSSKERPWHRSYGAIPHRLPERPAPLYSILEGHDPSRVALILKDVSLTYGDLLAQTARIAAALADYGVGVGDRVVLLLPNSFGFVQVYFGALRRGAVVVALNPLYTTSELAGLLMDAQPTLLVVPVEALGKLPQGLPFGIMFADTFGDAEREHEAAAAYPGAVSLSDWLDHVQHEWVDHVVQPEKDLAVLQYTGGTTGTPKGAMLTHWNLLSNALQARWWISPILEAEQQQSILIGLPMFHVYGMTVGMNLGLLIGARLILLPRFTPESAVEAVRHHSPTLFPGAPTMYVALEAHARQSQVDLSSIQGCLSGSAPLPVSVQESFERATGGKLVEGYGLSEASPVTHCQPLWDVTRKVGIGLPFPGTDARVVDDQGQDVPVGERGELLVRGPQVMQGYWNRADETHQVLRDGWLWTGDVAVMDNDGYFQIVDRRKDLIICSGFNVYPREVEDVLYSFPGVLEAAVVGVPDPYRGETIKAYVVARPQASLDLDDLTAYCRQHLAGYKIPRFYEVVDSLPKSAVGKILRRALREGTPDSSPTSPGTPQTKG